MKQHPTDNFYSESITLQTAREKAIEDIETLDSLWNAKYMEAHNDEERNDVVTSATNSFAYSYPAFRANGEKKYVYKPIHFLFKILSFQPKPYELKLYELKLYEQQRVFNLIKKLINAPYLSLKYKRDEFTQANNDISLCIEAQEIIKIWSLSLRRTDDILDKESQEKIIQSINTLVTNSERTPKMNRDPIFFMCVPGHHYKPIHFLLRLNRDDARTLAQRIITADYLSPRYKIKALAECENDHTIPEEDRKYCAAMHKNLKDLTLQKYAPAHAAAKITSVNKTLVSPELQGIATRLKETLSLQTNRWGTFVNQQSNTPKPSTLPYS